MNASEILSKNHDLHLHSQRFSDSWHSIQDVVRHGILWQVPPYWVGLSDHSPRLEELVTEEQADLVRRTSPASAPGLYQRVDDLLQRYIEEVRSTGASLQPENIRLLLGLELEWCQEGPLATPAALSKLDYVIAAYHGRQFTSPGQVERFLYRVASHPYTDIVAHPDQFLGKFDIHECNWKEVFSQFAAHHVLCEYNLATPLSAECFAVARDESEVMFVIGSDTHDFRDLSTRRVREAWSESLGGGFETARKYLTALLSLACAASRVCELSSLYSDPKRLEALELKMYTRTRRFQPRDVPLSADESDLIRILDEIPDNSLDRDFIVQRFTRFSGLPPERIASLLPADRFLEFIMQGRLCRQALLQAADE